MSGSYDLLCMIGPRGPEAHACMPITRDPFIQFLILFGFLVHLLFMLFVLFACFDSFASFLFFASPSPSSFVL